MHFVEKSIIKKKYLDNNNLTTISFKVHKMNCNEYNLNKFIQTNTFPLKTGIDKFLRKQKNKA